MRRAGFLFKQKNHHYKRVVVILVLSKCDGVCEICEPVVCALPFTLSLGSECVIGILFFTLYLREPFKYYFVCKGGGGYSPNP